MRFRFAIAMMLLVSTILAAQSRAAEPQPKPPGSDNSPSVAAPVLSIEDKVAIAKNRPGDVFCVWYSGAPGHAVSRAREVAIEFNLNFESYDVLTPEGKAKFIKRHQGQSPAERLKLIEAGGVSGQRGWKLSDGTVIFGTSQEYNALVPVKDTTWLYIMATTDPPTSRVDLMNQVLSARAVKAAAIKGNDASQLAQKGGSPATTGGATTVKLVDSNEKN